MRSRIWKAWTWGAQPVLIDKYFKRNGFDPELDVSRLPPHLVIGAGVATGFSVFVTFCMIEYFFLPVLGDGSQFVLYMSRDYLAVVAGLGLMWVIMKRKESRSRPVEQHISKRGQRVPFVAPKQLEITLVDVLPSELETLRG